MGRSRHAPAATSGGKAGSTRSLAQAAVAREGKTTRGGDVSLTLRIILTYAQAEALASRAIREGKNLNALASEILAGAPANVPGRSLSPQASRTTAGIVESLANRR